MSRLLSSIAFTLVLTMSVHAEAGARAYVCSFDIGAVASLDATLGDQPYTIGKNSFEMTFAAIDLDAHKAQLIGNQGAADVYAARSAGSTFFIEQTPSGSVIQTTVGTPSS